MMTFNLNNVFKPSMLALACATTFSTAVATAQVSTLEPDVDVSGEVNSNTTLDTDNINSTTDAQLDGQISANTDTEAAIEASAVSYTHLTLPTNREV